MKKRVALILVVAILLPQTAFAMSPSERQAAANLLLSELRNAGIADVSKDGSEPVAPPDNFPGTVTVTNTPVTGTQNVFDTKNVTLHITFTPNNPVDEIQISAQRGSQAVQGYPKNISIRPSQISTGLNEQLSLAEGVNTITVSVVSPAPAGSTTLTITIVSPAPTAAATPVPAATPQPTATPVPEYDWGRVRAYFTGGVIFSKERDNFSKTDLALAFVLDKNYLQNRIFNINTFFEARLTSILVSATMP
ncbi:MAG: hypothetical protein ICV60_23040, partial [Pyrinomonadaceae bacterium]|nr:hypothetical protein [Pyrinomonadaceae bacterium]